MNDIRIVEDIWLLDNLSKSLNFVCVRLSGENYTQEFI